MTERRRRSVVQSAEHLVIGPSTLSWVDDALVFHIDETAVPLPRPVRGKVRVRPTAITDLDLTLDTNGRHWWSPIAPVCRVEVDMESPDLRWSGHGYLDTNSGLESLEAGFTKWQWSRASRDDETMIFYDVTGSDGEDRSIALGIDSTGNSQTLDAPPLADLPKGLWRVPRSVRADPDHPVSVIKTLEDAPFYARSLVSGIAFGRPFEAVHESLSLERFRTRWVKVLLPFRMPRTLR